MMSENRCKRCNRKLSNPSANYGATCARIMGVREAYDQSGRDTREDFDHSAHLTADKLQRLGVNWATEDGKILYQQLFAQEFGNSPQIIRAEESRGMIEQVLHDKDTDYRIEKLSSGDTNKSPKAVESGTPVNYQTTEQSAVRVMDHINTYDENMTQAEKDAWIAEYRKLLKEVEWEYSEGNLKNRAYGSVIDMRIELDRIQYLNAYAMSAQRGAGSNGEYLPREVREETLAVTRRAQYNMEKDIIARAILSEAKSGNQEDYNAVAQTITNRYNRSIGIAGENGPANKKYYLVSSETRKIIQDHLGNEKIEDNMPALHTYGREENGEYYNYSMAGLVLASAQYSGMTGGNNHDALNPHRGNKSQEDIDMAYTAAEDVMQGKTTHMKLADLGWTQFRGTHRVKENGNRIDVYNEDGKKLYSFTNRGSSIKWLCFGGNYYINYDEPD